ncbi:AI-2E family transporter [Salinilacihabitans rarus]|uniref:AI-2E family transporter n=1 Tax=Salinilacihabitans rarus TaxID=2961596 RepID=UPI0020C92CE6|nr:AI-2E family transporter [Salinilacihabitans rarus]
MDWNRRYVLAGVVVTLGAVTGLILLEVLGTILFALTVALVLAPVKRLLVQRGFSAWTASAAATVAGFVGVVAVFSPIVLTLYLRFDELVVLVEGLPAELSVTFLEETYVLRADDLRQPVLSYLRSLALSLAAAAPVLAIKFALFVILLFALVLEGGAVGRAAIAPVPHEHRDVAYALARRARGTLYALYVLQVATGVATMAIAYPLFSLLGYESALAIALIAGILQFVPIIGPSMLVAPIALYHVAAGEVASGILVGVLGLGLIAWLPDVLVRPRLARRSAGLPGSLYFVGFTGGLFTMGAIGIVVGPLVVALFVEAVDLLAAEVNADDSFAEYVYDDLPPGGEDGDESDATPRPPDVTDSPSD